MTTIFAAGIARRVSALGFIVIALLAINISSLAQTTKPRPKVVTNEQSTYRYAYQHGYRAGVEDGYIKGKSDFNEKQPINIDGSEAFRNADRGYNNSYGTRAEYQEGYRIGFELGYNDGYYGRPYSISLPANLGKVVVAALNASGDASGAAVASTDSSRPRTTDKTTDNRPPQDEVRPVDRQQDNRNTGGARGAIVIPDGIQMKIRLDSPISTKTNKEGDRFTAVVLTPSDYVDAVIEGHISKLNKSGKATGKTEMALAFDTIHLRDGRSGRMAAQVERVYESETVKTIDEEGNVETGSRTKDTAVRSVGGAALGAIIGGIAGGGKGAAIGAAVGAGVGVGSVLVQDGKDLMLEPGTEILIRTAAPAKSRD